MWTAILRGFPTGFQGQPSALLATLGECYETREEARVAATKRWGSKYSPRRTENSTIQCVDTDRREWSYLNAH
jgi:hypothetical protein